MEVLDPTSGLEEDLGIDSVKLGEVFAVLREQYALPEKLDLPREKLKTIAGIAEALEIYLSTTSTPSAGESSQRSSAATSSSGSHDASQMGTKVRQIFAEVTRYPLEVLDPGSALEEDLGIDS